MKKTNQNILGDINQRLNTQEQKIEKTIQAIDRIMFVVSGLDKQIKYLRGLTKAQQQEINVIKQKISNN